MYNLSILLYFYNAALCFCKLASCVFHRMLRHKSFFVLFEATTNSHSTALGKLDVKRNYTSFLQKNSNKHVPNGIQWQHFPVVQNADFFSVWVFRFLGGGSLGLSTDFKVGSAPAFNNSSNIGDFYSLILFNTEIFFLIILNELF